MDTADSEGDNAFQFAHQHFKFNGICLSCVINDWESSMGMSRSLSSRLQDNRVTLPPAGHSADQTEFFRRARKCYLFLYM